MNGVIKLVSFVILALPDNGYFPLIFCIVALYL